MRARDFFESVRNAALEAERTRQTIIRLEGRELPHGMSFEGSGRGGIKPDVMHSSDSTMDYEAMMERRIKQDWALIDRACVILYGKNQMGDGGICKDKSSLWADALWWRYCAAGTWDDVIVGIGYSERQCHRIIDDALSWIDETGYKSAMMEVM